jgi:tetratricopeptide (TPR) repeat protein
MELTIEQALQQGVAAHKEGKLQDAERLYRAILQSQPANPDANHNLGVLAVSVNKAEAALPLFKTALEANPKIEQFWLSYIDALIKQKQFDDAKQVLEQAKKQCVDGDRLNSLDAQLSPKSQKPNTARVSPPQELLNSLLGHYQNGRFSDAEKLSLEITQDFPKHQFAWKVLGVVLGATGRKSEAVDTNQIAVALSPQDAEAHSNLGITLKELGRLDEAEASHTQAIALKPDFAEAHSNLGITLKELGRLDEAEASYNQAIALKPDFAEAHSNLGITLKELGRLDEAEASCAQAITLKPDFAEAHSNLGNTLKELGRLDEAEASYNQAIALKPDYAEAHNNLGITLRAMNQLDEAITQYNCAINIDPSFCLAHFNLSQIMLLRKLNHDGWKKYEYRDSKKNFRNKILQNLNIPEWNKEDLTNKKLIIYSEQGIGDSVQFLRYIKAISKHNTKIFLYTNKNLCYLFSNVAEIDSLIFEDKDVPFCDFYISLMSLPFIFKNLKNIPTTYNFFPKNINLDNSWKKIIKLNKKIQIGLSWQGSADHKEDYKRSVSLLIFSPFFKIKNLTFTSLQKNYGQEQITQFNLEGKIVDFYKNKIVGSNNKFEDTISIIKNMDLVITVDTAVAHISATLGKETWILLPLVNDFRWGTKNEKTVWYKNVKLFRQTKINQWQDVVIKIKKNLENLIDKKTTDKI